MLTKFPRLFTVETLEGIRLDRWLKGQIPNLNQGLLEKLLRQGKIKLNDKKVKSSERLKKEDVISVYENITDLQEKKQENVPKAKEPFNLTNEEISWLESLVLWEDEELFIINKPTGLASQGGTKTLRHIDGYLQALGKIKNQRYRLVHRLDRDTSGVFVVAKTLEMASHLAELFKEGVAHKTYWAIVLGHPKPGIGKVKASLIKEKGDKEKMVVDEKYGKKAVTVYRTMKKLIHKRKPELTWLELTPETGRTHQLRVHCQYLGCPIIGDGKYGGKEALETGRTLHLHAREIKITDRNGNKMMFTASPPQHFEETLLRYGIEWNKNLYS